MSDNINSDFSGTVIYQINTTDIGGGAEKIAYSLFSECQKKGIISKMLVGIKKSQNRDIFVIPRGHFWINSIIYKLCTLFNLRENIKSYLINVCCWKYLISILQGHEFFNVFKTVKEIQKVMGEKPDIIHCHNLHGGYFDISAIRDISINIPTIITMHDAWLLGGHCAHSFDCEHWKSGCGNCPYLSVYPRLLHDGTEYNWIHKSKIYHESKLHIVTPSQWLMDKVQESILKPAILSSRVIPNGIDLQIYHPGDKKTARSQLNFPINAKILLFSANGIRKNVWKDYKTLRSALQNLTSTNHKIVCVALGEESPVEHIGSNIDILFIPYETDEKIISAYYRAADIYIHPTRVDTFPTSVLEALACGVPVIATDVGGIPEEIIPDVTGYLVPIGDYKTLAKYINHILSNSDLATKMGLEAALDAKKRFSKERMINDYLVYYDEIIKFPN